MEVMHERSGGVDVHKDQVVAVLESRAEAERRIPRTDSSQRRADCWTWPIGWRRINARLSP